MKFSLCFISDRMLHYVELYECYFSVIVRMVLNGLVQYQRSALTCMASDIGLLKMAMSCCSPSESILVGNVKIK